MFKANLNKVLLGSTIQLNWSCEHLRFNYFLYLKKSHKSSSKDRKLMRIAEKGSLNITVTDRNFECHLRKFTLFGWKTLASYKPEVIELHLDVPQSIIAVPRVSIKKRPKISIKVFSPRIKQPGLRIVLPQPPVIDYATDDLKDNPTTNQIQSI